MTRRILVLLLTCMLPLASVSLALAQSNLIILARTGATSFNLPNGSSISSSTVAINDARQVGIRINTVGGSGGAPGVFMGNFATGSGTGGIVFQAPQGNIISDVNINHSGAAVYFDLDQNRAVTWDPVNGGRTLNSPLGATSMTGLMISDAGQIGGRIQFGFTGNAVGTFPPQTAGSPPLNTYYVDTGIDSSSPYSFLFVPRMGRTTEHVGAKVMRSSAAGGGDQVRRFAFDGTSVLIASTVAADPTSPFSSISNGVSISDNGLHVAFQARFAGTTTDGVFVWDAMSGLVNTIAVAGQGGVNTIDAFAPDVNDLGQVVFRGNDSSNRNSVFMFDGSSLVRVAGVGDQIMTDIGLRELGRRDGQASQSGAPRINNFGDVAFAFQYFDPANMNSIADGTLVLARAIPEPAGLLLLSGFVLIGLARGRRRR